MLLRIPFLCWISITWLTDVWMSKLQIFKQRQSLISSQVLFELSASDISVHISPFDFACANIVLLLPVKSEVVSISMNQSSNCEELLHVWKSWYHIVKCLQRTFFVQYIKCLYIAAKPPQWVPAVWTGDVWELTCYVCILGGLWCP